jgi:hypothetical protein
MRDYASLVFKIPNSYRLSNFFFLNKFLNFSNIFSLEDFF